MRPLVLAPLCAALTLACGDEILPPPTGSDTLLVIVPRTVLLTVGDSLRLTGVATTPAGDTLDVPVEFTARNPAVASVTADGLVHAEALGTGWIVAAAIGRLDSVLATVAASVELPTLQLLTNQLANPVFLTQPPGDSDRLFVVEQAGRIRILRNDVLQPRPFVDLSAIVLFANDERGLLSMAFDPAYQQNGFFYVSYVDRQNDSRVVRYRVSTTDADSADPGSAALVLLVEQPTYPNHKGGLIAFGPDGMLYFGLGDGGSGGDPENRAQNLDSLLGKMLRIDVRTPPYTVPSDNPFVGRNDARPEIWAYGLRNPWRFSFDRVTGDLYTGDVGQGEREEIDVQPASSPGGENYGWRIMEGFACFQPPTGCSTAGLTLPVLDYDRTGGICAVTGGYVYRGSALPILAGRYLYSDFCAGFVRSFTFVGGQALDRIDWTAEIDPGPAVTSWGEDNAGELYILTGTGSVYRLVPQGAIQGTEPVPGPSTK
jgi:glucose/arabinose dehydrogenase